jgi:hypothetical protein
VVVTFSQALVGYWTRFSTSIAASGESKGIDHGDLPTTYKFGSKDPVPVDTIP